MIIQPTDSERFRHLASYQEKPQDNPDGASNIVRCNLCPHNCLVYEGKTGSCKTRINRGGELFSMTYGKPCSVSVDPIEKKPLFHFFPGTGIYSLAAAGCNFRCLNCQNWSISQVSPKEVDCYDMIPAEVVRKATLHNTESIAFTYTEPTVFYEYVYDTAILAREKGLKTVMVSNGYINTRPLIDLCPFLNAANIDLKCFNDSVYHKLTGGGLMPVLNTLVTLKERGVWLEITNLIIPSWSDEPEMIKKMCKWLVSNGFADTPLHFSKFFPTHKLSQLEPTQTESLLRAKETAEMAGIKYVYIGNMPDLHGENTICPNCGKIVLERKGYHIVSNNIKTISGEICRDGSGLCRFCGKRIAGVFN